MDWLLASCSQPASAKLAKQEDVCSNRYASAITLILLSSFCMTAAQAAGVTLWGERQRKRISNGSSEYIESQAEWINAKRGGKGLFLKLKADKSAIAKGGKGPVVACAAKLSFSKASQIDYLSFTYHKLKEGTFFMETTDPIVRVAYYTSDNLNTVKYKTLSWPLSSAGYTWHKKQLTDQGLNPETTFISAVAIVAKPKVNNFVDDYASMEVEQIKYHEFLSKDTNVKSPNIENSILCDGEGGGSPSDELLNGA